MTLLRLVSKNSRIRFEGLAYRPVHPDNLDHAMKVLLADKNDRLFVNMSTMRLTVISENFEVDEIGPCPLWNKVAEMRRRMDALANGMEASKESPKNVRQD